MTRLNIFLCAAVCLACALNVRALETKSQKAVLPNLPGDVRGVVFSPDAKWLAVSTGQVIKVFDWQRGTAGIELSGGLGAVFSADGLLIAFPGQDEFNNDGLMLWDLAANKKRLFIAGDNVLSPVFVPGGKLISAAVGSRIKTWDLASGKEAQQWPALHKCSLTVIAYMQDGSRLISADAHGLCVLWDMSEAEPKKIAEFKRDNNDTPISALAVVNKGSHIALATGGGEILFLDAAKLTLSGAVKGHAQGLTVKSVAFAPDGRLLASACSGVEDIEIKLWDAAAPKQFFAFTGHSGAVNCVAFAPDGKWLATGSDDKSAKIWDVAALLLLAAPPPAAKPKKDAE